MTTDDDNVSSEPLGEFSAPGLEPGYLITHTRFLEKETKRLEKEKQILESDRIRLNRELQTLKVELDRLRAPPLFVGTIVEVLTGGRAIVKSSSGPQFLVTISKHINQSKIKPNDRVCLNQRTFSIVEVLSAVDNPLVKLMEVEKRPDISFSNVGGLNKQILELREVVELPLTNPGIFEKVGIVPPKGVLLHGPPGTGKTLLAKALAGDAKAVFIKVIASELVQKFIGEGAKLVRDIFSYANRNSPAILFIDELDAIGSKRTDVATSGDREVQRTLMQLLSLMDGFDSFEKVKIIAATNRLDTLDQALLRPGRFDRIIEISPPDAKGREEIFKIHMENLNVEDGIPLDYLLKNTVSFSGADIRNVIIEAGMFTIRALREKVTLQDFKNAFKLIKEERNKGESSDLSSFV